MKQANFNSNPFNLTYDSFKIQLGIIMPTKLKRAYTGLQGQIRAYEAIKQDSSPLEPQQPLEQLENSLKNIENLTKKASGGSCFKKLKSYRQVKNSR